MQETYEPAPRPVGQRQAKDAADGEGQGEHNPNRVPRRLRLVAAERDGHQLDHRLAHPALGHDR